MAKARAENFPVASRVLPPALRPHLMAVYGFARLVDDAGDEAAGDRLALLDQLEADLELAFAGRPAHPLIAGLQPTISRFALPIEPFRALIEANRQDQRVRRYRSFDDLLGYCRLSANPVGELVLRIFGAATPERMRLSDKICSALQLVEHWQDVREDYARGRVYLPAEDLERFAVLEPELAGHAAGPAFRALMDFEVRRARQMLDEGAPLIRALSGREAFAVAAFVAGGRSALDAIERAGYDVLTGSPRPRPLLRLRALVATLLPRVVNR